MKLRGLFLLTFACSLMAARASSDLTVTIRTSSDTGSETRTEFVKGPLRKTEYSGADHKMARILRCDEAKAFTLNLDWGIYSQDLFLWTPAKNRPSNRKGTDSAQGIRPQRETIDTGERRLFWGYEGRRVITQVIHHSPPASRPHTEVLEETIDTWYIGLILPTGCAPPDNAASESNFATAKDPAVLAGFLPVKQTWTTRTKVYSADGSTREITRHVVTEVIGISHDAISPAIFEIPANFRKVGKVDWPY